MALKKTKGKGRKKTGRPKRQESERRTHRVALSLTAAEFKKLEVAATADRREIAVFARMRLMEALNGRR
jgi:hypothetical protein